MSNCGPKLVKKDELNLRNSVIYRRNQIYVPPAKRDDVLRESHDSPLSAHDGIQETFSKYTLAVVGTGGGIRVVVVFNLCKSCFFADSSSRIRRSLGTYCFS